MQRSTEVSARSAGAAPARSAGALVGAALGALLLGACTPAPELVPPAFAVLPVPGTPCIGVVERIQHLDQPSALGFSAVELLARVSGDSDAPLIWLPPEGSSHYNIAYGPESGLSNLRLRILPAQGEVRYRHELLADGAPEGTECDDGVLDVPVTVSLNSGAQALEETFSARLEAKVVYRARLAHRFPSVHGGFAITELSSLDPERNFSAGPLSLEVVVWEGGSQGSLSTEITPSYTAKASAATREAWPAPLESGETTQLALWPSAEPCGAPSQNSLPSDAKVLGFSVSDVLASLARESGKQLTWSTGESTTLELSFVTPASELCQGVGDALTFETSVRVRTFDGRVAAEVPVQISAANAAGSIGEINVQSWEAPGLIPAQASLTSAGKPKGRAELRVDLDASFRPGESSGTLTLSGLDGSDAAAPARELASGHW